MATLRPPVASLGAPSEGARASHYRAFASSRLTLLAPPLLLLLLLSSRAPAALAQRAYPLTGSDFPLPTSGNASGSVTPFDINTTVLLERVLSIDEAANGYRAIWWVILTWPDASAGATVAAATAAAMSPTSATPCNRTCDSSGLLSQGCCDGIWLPHIQLPNLITYDEDQMPRSRINANATSGTVSWATRLVGTWYAPLDYRAYPFDHQHMLLEIALADSQAPLAGLRWNHVAQMNHTAHTKGPDVSGWRIKWSKGKVYDSRKCHQQYGITAPRYVTASQSLPGGSTTGLGGGDNSSDPVNTTTAAVGAATVPAATLAAAAPATAALYDTVRLTDRHLSDNHLAGTTQPLDCSPSASSAHWGVYDEGRALYPPVVLVADIMVKRVASYYVLTNLIPVLLITLVSFVVFFMPQSALGDRMAVVLTMFLSLTAMQFVFDFPPANYINALQMVVLVSYIMISLACIESLIVNRIATVSHVVGNKRACVHKYRGLLTKGAFDRHLSRELFSKGGSGAAGGGVGGGGGGKHTAGHYAAAMGRGRTRGSAVRQPGLTCVHGGTAAHHKGYTKAGSTACRHEDSAIEGQLLLTQPPGYSAPAPSSAPAPAPAEANLTSAVPAATIAAPPGVHPATSTSRTVRSARVNFSSTELGPTLATTAAARRASTGTASAAVSAAAAAATLAAPAATTRHHAASTAGSSICGDGAPAGDIGGAGSDDTVPDLLPPASHLPSAVHIPGTGYVPTPFASSRTYNTSFASPDHHGGDARSICSAGSRASTVATIAANFGSMWRRCRALGFWRSLRAVAVAVATWLVAVVTAPRRYYRQCKEDPEFARFLATKVDKWSCIVSVSMYVLCITVLLWVEVKVGDHKLMLGEAPGNM